MILSADENNKEFLGILEHAFGQDRALSLKSFFETNGVDCSYEDGVQQSKYFLRFKNGGNAVLNFLPGGLHKKHILIDSTFKKQFFINNQNSLEDQTGFMDLFAYDEDKELVDEIGEFLYNLFIPELAIETENILKNKRNELRTLDEQFWSNRIPTILTGILSPKRSVDLLNQAIEAHFKQLTYTKQLSNKNLVRHKTRIHYLLSLLNSLQKWHSCELTSPISIGSLLGVSHQFPAHIDDLIFALVILKLHNNINNNNNIIHACTLLKPLDEAAIQHDPSKHLDFAVFCLILNSLWDQQKRAWASEIISTCFNIDIYSHKKHGFEKYKNMILVLHKIMSSNLDFVSKLINKNDYRQDMLAWLMGCFDDDTKINIIFPLLDGEKVHMVKKTYKPWLLKEYESNNEKVVKAIKERRNLFNIVNS